MNDSFAAQNRFRFAEVIADVGLRADPIDVARDSIFESDLRFVAGRADFGRVAGEMAHFTGTKFSARFRFDAALEKGGKNLRDFANRHSFATPDVTRKSIALVGFSCE